ncbi:MAG: hypothetical protein RL722_1972 [Pseudomonadota bacterium]|jgi:hypothetical protein
MTPAASAPDQAAIELRGVDFSSAPTRRKPITLATGRLMDLSPGAGAPVAVQSLAVQSLAVQSLGVELPGVQLLGLRRLETLAEFAASLAEPGPWVGGFDFPFGLPRELIQALAPALGWPQDDWAGLMRHYGRLERDEVRAHFDAFRAARPVGQKFAHRACDARSGASPSMKLVNPPVALMMHAGVPPLIEAGCQLPGLREGDPQRVALEAYPGLLAREFLGRRSYKGDGRAARDDPGRRQARVDLLDALAAGNGRLGLRLVLDQAQRRTLIDDGQADLLDAVLCLLQAAWAALKPGWGLPADMDPIEGWIVSA